MQASSAAVRGRCDAFLEDFGQVARALGRHGFPVATEAGIVSSCPCVVSFLLPMGSSRRFEGWVSLQNGRAAKHNRSG